MTTTDARRWGDLARREPGADLSGARAPALPWRDLVRWSLVGVLGLVLLVGVDLARHGGRNPVSLIQPGTEGPSTDLIAADFPDVVQPGGPGLDGQQYYAMARDPLHLDETAAHLDNPRYRFQRPLLPWTAWLLHPIGGGPGLIGALALVGVAGAFGGALATGALSRRWGGPVWLAAAFPLLPGAYWSLRVTVSDALALALALGAIALADRRRQGPALLLGVLAVLAKEPTVLVLLGWALHRRSRQDAVLVAIPAVVVVAWMGWLGLQLPADADRAQDLGLPFVGLVAAWRDIWSDGRELVGMACTLGGLGLGGTALVRRGLTHPLGWAIAVQVGFLLIMGVNPTAMNFGSTRMAMPLLILSLLALLAPGPSRSIGAATAPADQPG